MSIKNDKAGQLQHSWVLAICSHYLLELTLQDSWDLLSLLIRINSKDVSISYKIFDDLFSLLIGINQLFNVVI